MLEAGNLGLRITPIATGFWKETEAKLKAQKQGKAELTVDANIKKASSEIALFRARQQARQINLKLNIDEKSLRTANDKIRYIEHSWKQSDIKRSIRVQVFVAGATLLPAVTQGVLSLTAAITDLGRASFALPGLLGGVGAAAGTLATGMSGVGKAFEAAGKGMEDAERAADKFARASRDLEKAQKGIVQAFKEANREIQDQKDRLAQGQLSVEQAQLNVLRANQEVAKGGFRNFIDYRQALIGVKQANLDLSIAIKQNSRNVQDYYDNASRSITQTDTFRDSLDNLKGALSDYRRAQYEAAGMTEEFISTMKQLAPSGQDFVLQLLRIKGAFKEVQTAVQDNLFKGLGDSLTDLANKQLPMLEKGMSSVARSINSNFKTVIGAIGSDANTSNISKVFDRTAIALKAANPGLQSFTDGLLHLTEVGSRFLPRMAVAFNRVMDRFDAFIDRADKDGSLERWIDQGLKLIASLGRSLINIGSILNSVTDAYQRATGNVGGLATTVEKSLSGLAKRLASPQGQQRLVGYIREAREFLGVIKDALPGIAKLFGMVGDAARGFAEDFFPLLSSLGRLLENHANTVASLLKLYIGFKVIKPLIVGVGKAWRDASGAFQTYRLKQKEALENSAKAWKAAYDAQGIQFAAQQRLLDNRIALKNSQFEWEYARGIRQKARLELNAAEKDVAATQAALSKSSKAQKSALIIPGQNLTAQKQSHQSLALAFERAEERKKAALKSFGEADKAFQKESSARYIMLQGSQDKMARSYKDVEIATNNARAAQRNLSNDGLAAAKANGWTGRMRTALGSGRGGGLAGAMGGLAASIGTKSKGLISAMGSLASAAGAVVTAIGSAGATVGMIYALDQLTAAQNRNRAAADNLRDSQEALANTLAKGTGSATAQTLEENARQLQDAPNPVHPDDRGQNFNAAQILKDQLGVSLPEAVELTLPTERKKREARLAPADAAIIAAVPNLQHWKDWNATYQANGVTAEIYGKALNGDKESIGKVEAARKAIYDASVTGRAGLPMGFGVNVAGDVPNDLGAAQEQLPRSGPTGNLRDLSLAAGATRRIGDESAAAGAREQAGAAIIPQGGLNRRGRRVFGPFQLGPGGAILNPDGSATIEVDRNPDDVVRGWSEGAAGNGIEVERRFPDGAVIRIAPGEAEKYFAQAPGYAAGGSVWGAGTATSDSIPAMLSNGEFVINAKSARAIGHETLSQLNSGLPKFAPGGPVDLDSLFGDAGNGSNTYVPPVPMVRNPQTLPEAIGRPTRGNPLLGGGSLFGPAGGGVRANAYVTTPPNTLPGAIGPITRTPAAPATSGVSGFRPDPDAYRDLSVITGGGSRPGPGGASSAPGIPGSIIPPAGGPASPGGYVPMADPTDPGLTTPVPLPGGPAGSPPATVTPGVPGLTPPPGGMSINQLATLADALPYLYGGGHPGYAPGTDQPLVNGFDCSGLASAVANLATGRPIMSDVFATGNQREGLTSRGFLNGMPPPGQEKGALIIGWDEGHTAMTLPDGRNLEAATSTLNSVGDGIMLGPKARAGGSFPNIMYLPADLVQNAGELGDVPIPPINPTQPGFDPTKPVGIGNSPLGRGALGPGVTDKPLPDIPAGPAAGAPLPPAGPLDKIKDPFLEGLKKIGIALLEGILGFFGINLDVDEILSGLFGMGKQDELTPDLSGQPDSNLLSQMDTMAEYYESVEDKAAADAIRKAKDDYLSKYTGAAVTDATEDLAAYFESIGQPEQAARLRADSEKLNTAPPVQQPGTWATGGHVKGAGGPTSDSIPAMLSDGEFVMRAAAVKNIGVDRLHAMNKFAGGGLVGYAPGGSVDGGDSGVKNFQKQLLLDAFKNPVPFDQTNTTPAAQYTADDIRANLRAGVVPNAGAADTRPGWAKGVFAGVAEWTKPSRYLEAAGVNTDSSWMNTKAIHVPMVSDLMAGVDQVSSLLSGQGLKPYGDGLMSVKDTMDMIAIPDLYEAGTALRDPNAGFMEQTLANLSIAGALPIPGAKGAGLGVKSIYDGANRMSGFGIGKALNRRQALKGIDLSGIKGTDRATRRDIKRSLADIRAAYPDAPLQRVALADDTGDNAYAWANRIDRSIYLNKNWFGKGKNGALRESIQSGVDSGWGDPIGNRSSIFSVLAHEYGHIVDFHAAGDNLRKVDINNELAEMFSRRRPDLQEIASADGDLFDGAADRFPSEYRKWLEENLPSYSLQKSMVGLTEINRPEAIANAFGDVLSRGRWARPANREIYALFRRQVDGFDKYGAVDWWPKPNKVVPGGAWQGDAGPPIPVMGTGKPTSLPRLPIISQKQLNWEKRADDAKVEFNRTRAAREAEERKLWEAELRKEFGDDLGFGPGPRDDLPMRPPPKALQDQSRALKDKVGIPYLPKLFRGQAKNQADQWAGDDLEEALSMAWQSAPHWRAMKTAVGQKIIAALTGGYSGIDGPMADRVSKWLFARTDWTSPGRRDVVDGLGEATPWNLTLPGTSIPAWGSNPQRMWMDPSQITSVDDRVLGMVGGELAARALHGAANKNPLYRGLQLPIDILKGYKKGQKLSLGPQSFSGDRLDALDYATGDFPWRDIRPGSTESVLYELMAGSKTGRVGDPNNPLGLLEQIGFGDFTVKGITPPGKGTSGDPAAGIWRVLLEQTGLIPTGKMNWATGGHVRGAGTGKSDSIPALLSNGEFVMNADATRHWGVGNLMAMNRYADGGPVVPPFNLPILPGLTPSPEPPNPNTPPAPPPPPSGSSDPDAFKDQAAEPSSPTGSSDPDAFKELSAIGTSLLSPKGGGGGGSASARPSKPKDPRAIMGMASTSDNHLNPALASGIQGAFSTAGAIAGTAAALGMSVGTGGAAAPAAGAASTAIAAGAAMAGQVATGAANVISSLLVGTVTPSDTGQGYGAPLLPAAPTQRTSNFQSIHNGNIVTNNLSEYSRLRDRKDAQKAAPFFNRVNS